MRKFAALLGALAAMVVSARPASAEELYVKIADVNGPFAGWYNPVEGYGETSLVDHGRVESLNWSVQIVMDSGSSTATGRRQHRPVVLRVRLAGGVLSSLSALTTNTRVTAELLWFSDADAGEPTLLQRLDLSQAIVSSVSVQTVREDGQLRTYADISMTYTTIGITDYATQLSYTDNIATVAQ